METYLISEVVLKKFYIFLFFYRKVKQSEDLIRKIRVITGDKFLISILEMFQGQVLSSMNEKIYPVLRN